MEMFTIVGPQRHKVRFERPVCKEYYCSDERQYELSTDYYDHLFEDVPLVEIMYIVFTCLPGESYCRRLRSLLLYLGYVFRVLINSLACLFFVSFSPPPPSFHFLSFVTFSSSPVMTAVRRKLVIVLWVQRDSGVGRAAFSHPRKQTIQAKRWVRQARASSCPAGLRVPLCSAGHCAVLARQSQGLWAPARFPLVTIWQGHRRRVAAHVCNHLADQPAQVAVRYRGRQNRENARS